MNDLGGQKEGAGSNHPPGAAKEWLRDQPDGTRIRSIQRRPGAKSLVQGGG